MEPLEWMGKKEGQVVRTGYKKLSEFLIAPGLLLDI